VKDLSWLVLAVVFGALVAWAPAAETPRDYCRDYVVREGETCVYPTELVKVGGVRVCRCPGSQPCGGQ
jgi:hypothetical protein